MHTAKIGRIGFDKAGRFVVTASHDKTARVWDARDGRLLQILRPPIGDGNEGKLYAVALSPDGALVACGGWTGFEWDKSHSIYLFDRASGALRRRIAGLPNIINDLEFAPDGARLAATLGGNGVRVFRVADGALDWEDRDYGEQSNGASWDGAGRLATTCLDGLIRLYDARGQLLRKARAPSGERPFGIAFSPDGARLAVGYDDSTRVDVLDGRDLSLLFSPATADVTNGNFYGVAWSADGSALFAGGRYVKGGSNPIRRWADGGRGAARDLPAAQNTIFDLQPLPGGALAWGAGDPAWGVLDGSGARRNGQTPPIADLRTLLDNFRLAGDGTLLAFAYEQYGKSPARFDVATRLLESGDKLASQAALQAPLTEVPGLAVIDWQDTYQPKLNGRALTLKQYERSRSLALAPDGSGFLLGTEWSLRWFGRDGVAKWQVPAPSAAWAVNVARRGDVCAAAYGDGTIRWYRVRDGVELLAFFPHADRKRWVLWTPTGYYDASPGGEELIGWHLNNGRDREADFFPASRFRDKFYRPDVVAKVLSTLDEAKALQQADAESNRRPSETTTIAQVLPPVIRIIEPQDGATVSSSSLRIKYFARAPADAPVTKVRALIDGRPVETARDLKLVSAARDEQSSEITVTIPPRDCEVSLIAENKNAASEAATVRVKWQGATPTTTEFLVKPKLYVLAIGVSTYANPEFNLNYAAKDAKDFAAACAGQKGLLYRDVESKLLCDADATRDNIVDGLEWIQLQTTQRDVAIVFLSGHGVNAPPNNDYYFVPHNFNSERIRATGVVFSEIKQTVQNIAGKALFFVDSCHSGNVMGGGKSKGVADINAVINELASAENGAVVFSASTGRQVALEHPDWNNGAFTKAVVEGLIGKEALFNGRVTVKSLDFYVSERVKKLTGGKQTPTTAVPPSVPDFPIAAQ